MERVKPMGKEGEKRSKKNIKNRILSTIDLKWKQSNGFKAISQVISHPILHLNISLFY